MIKYQPNYKIALQTVVCMFAQTNTDHTKTPGAFDYCTGQFDWTSAQKKSAMNCAFNGEGDALLRAAVDATPTHTFIPWTAVEGHDLSDDDRDLINTNVLEYVCNTFHGDKPHS